MGELGGGASGNRGTPPTSTVEELFEVAEDRASGSEEDAAASEAAVVDQCTATPILRTSAVDPRGRDSGIEAFEPVPLAEGDFLETADPRDILDALGVDQRTVDVLGEVRSPDMRAAAALLGVILSQGGSEGVRMSEGSPEPEEMMEKRVTAVEEAKAFAKNACLAFSPETYVPPLHLFEPVGMNNYAPVNADYPGDLLLRDRDRHISSTWTTVKTLLVLIIKLLKQLRILF
ncbi:hypothetical protein RHMOL_Rhmol04G0219800 [Rhododendron molle]|uniref:Uncharacterized protein n=1 Tax=Rhododendron molle TaxID=49168 RepID=A0ACC0P2W3_RHOML|nr:hypothetical protein RHMOL_Rhmol04G0219800 [Rhododendron molle]